MAAIFMCSSWLLRGWKLLISDTQGGDECYMVIVMVIIQTAIEAHSER